MTDTTQPRKKRRVFLWFFLAVQALFVIWIITGATGGHDYSDCGSLTHQQCADAQDVGTGIGVVLIVVFWCVVDFLLAVIYGIYRLAKRT
ncbi:hypothetical protein AB3X52_09695 [Nocardioides sp. DS6]|uniref:Uncharacterized protein n=1 Tax=Nocardioides eburneus TaxID=3231482 RepID=A0ABV3T0X4_9ACTN